MLTHNIRIGILITLLMTAAYMSLPQESKFLTAQSQNVCGDGKWLDWLIEETGEECDLGACTDTKTVCNSDDKYSLCTSSCALGPCGRYHTDPGGTYVTRKYRSEAPECYFYCGDGEKQGTEQCDPGREYRVCEGSVQVEPEKGDPPENAIQCLDSCEDGSRCITYPSHDCSANCFEIAKSDCGNGELQREKDEECDDGNNESGDGCQSDCRCGSPTQIFHEELEICVECYEDSQCAGNEVCDVGSFTCAECLRDDDCKGSKPFCNVALQECVYCRTDADCPSDNHSCKSGDCVCGPQGPGSPVCCAKLPGTTEYDLEDIAENRIRGSSEECNVAYCIDCDSVNEVSCPGFTTQCDAGLQCVQVLGDADSDPATDEYVCKPPTRGDFSGDGSGGGSGIGSGGGSGSGGDNGSGGSGSGGGTNGSGGSGSGGGTNGSGGGSGTDGSGGGTGNNTTGGSGGSDTGGTGGSNTGGSGGSNTTGGSGGSDTGGTGGSNTGGSGGSNTTGGSGGNNTGGSDRGYPEGCQNDSQCAAAGGCSPLCSINYLGECSRHCTEPVCLNESCVVIGEGYFESCDASACDFCPDDPAKTSPGTCGCGEPDIDSDGDGTPDCADQCPDDPGRIVLSQFTQCDCGMYPEGDSDGDGLEDCWDECPNDPTKDDPGQCGCGEPDTDSDSDGTADCMDECPLNPNKTEPGICDCGSEDSTDDSDGDGILDCNETHSECVYSHSEVSRVGDTAIDVYECIEVDGPGQDFCSEDEGCQPPYYAKCVPGPRLVDPITGEIIYAGGQCVTWQGEGGEDECSEDADCDFVIAAGPGPGGSPGSPGTGPGPGGSPGADDDDVIPGPGIDDDDGVRSSSGVDDDDTVPGPGPGPGNASSKSSSSQSFSGTSRTGSSQFFSDISRSSSSQFVSGISRSSSSQFVSGFSSSAKFCTKHEDCDQACSACEEVAGSCRKICPNAFCTNDGYCSEAGSQVDCDPGACFRILDGSSSSGVSTNSRISMKSGSSRIIAQNPPRGGGVDDDDGNGDNDDGIRGNRLREDDNGDGDNDDGIAGNRVERIVAAASVCGNGILEGGEECDDSNRRDEDGCNSTCLLEVGICGDGIVQSLLGEQCEQSLHNLSLPYDCNRCRFLSRTCGDGVVDMGEECDEGLQNSTRPDNCRPDCSNWRCGDGVLDTGELCDDGNRINGDGCSRYCVDEDKDLSRGVVASDTANSDQSFTANALSQFLATYSQQFPRQPSMQPVPLQLPYAQLQPLIQSQGPAGETGPAAVAVIGAGAAAGIGWMRRRRK